MKDYTVQLTIIDRMILESYKTVLEGLADYLGNGYEMVLHSLASAEHSVIKIINGHYTGRKEGAPITDLALKMLEKIHEGGEKEHISYFTKNKKGEPLKATTIAIRGESSKVIGLFCINFYLNTGYADVLSNFIPLEAMQITTKSENFVANVDELIISSLEKIREEVIEDSQVLPSLRNREIVKKLCNQGIFELKDSVVKVANYMGISKNTVYMHLRKIQETNRS